jgi:glutathione S-transferase
MLELYHGEPNGYHLKPLVALHEKAIPFRTRRANSAAAAWPHSTEVLYNLEGDGPVLLVDQQPITDALFINMYLDEVSPGPSLRPSTPDGKWALLMWGRFVGEVLAPAIHTLGCSVYPEPGMHEALDPALQEDCLRKLQIAVAKIEAALHPGPWLLGNDYTLADIEVFGHAVSLPLLAPEHAGAHAAPLLANWLTRMHERPAVRAALAEAVTADPGKVFVRGPEHSRWG